MDLQHQDNDLLTIAKDYDETYEFDALTQQNVDKYYKLKNEYEISLGLRKQNIINNSKLSKKEKQIAFKQLNAKCIGCQSDGGTSFRSYKNKNGLRILEAFCKSTPKCDFKIILNLGSYIIINDSIVDIFKELNDIKKQIIIHKNNLLFGINDEKNQSFKTLVDNLEGANSDYSYFSEHYLNFNDNLIGEEKIILFEKELMRVINTFDDAIMSNNVLKLLKRVLNSDLFVDGSLSFKNYYVCRYFIKKIGTEINRVNEQNNINELEMENDSLDYKKYKLLINCRKLFNRILKYKYSKFKFKYDEKINMISFINNYANILEASVGDDAKTIEFVINVGNVNVNKNKNKNTKIKNKQLIKENADDDGEEKKDNDEEKNKDEDDDEDEDEDEDDDDEDNKPELIKIGEEISMEDFEDLEKE
jgi:hypothetical protein